jgi:hypothetical protein
MDAVGSIVSRSARDGHAFGFGFAVVVMIGHSGVRVGKD